MTINKFIPVYLYGAAIVVEGAFLLFSANSSFQLVKMATIITLSVGGGLAILAAFSRIKSSVQFAYHELHALAMLVYAAAVLVFCSTFEAFTTLTASLFLFYMFSEITFCNWLYNLKQKVTLSVVIIRLLLGLGTGIGTVFALNSPQYWKEIFGALFILVGLNVLLYIPVIKANDTKSAQGDLQTIEA